MDRIVSNPLKVDFHIHSIYSKYKDDISLIGDGKKENINTLLEKLNECGVNMCSITDHDYFSYNLYKELKSHENEGALKKVFPGVEFTLGIKDEDESIKPIHVIALFDDTNDNKVSKIESVLAKNIIEGKIKYSSEENIKYFSDEKLISMLNDIGLNVVLIAHQKSSVNSKKPYKNDLSTLNNSVFNDFLVSEVFEALEFKSMKSGLFNNVFAAEKNLNYEIVRFITGSDCHQWDSYPKHDAASTDTADFHFTYLKCLPSFKGVCMALSDYSRISLSDSLFSKDDKKLSEIKLKINDRIINIPLSKGINAIIGDNSIGKSLLVHKITNYMHTENKIKTGYEAYLTANKISLDTKIDADNLYKFDIQGEIRNRFQIKDESKNQDFLQSKYPEPPSADYYKSIIKNVIDKICDNLENKFNYDIEVKKYKTLELVDKDSKAKNISVSKLVFNKNKITGYTKITNYLKDIVGKIADPSFFIQYGLTDDDSLKIAELKKQIIGLYEKYKKNETNEERIYLIKDAINNGINKFNSDLKQYKSDIEKVIDGFENDKKEMATVFANCISYKRKIQNQLFTFDESIEIEAKRLSYGDYKFVRRFKGIKKIDFNYINSLVDRVLKKGNKICPLTITEDELLSRLKDNKELDNLKPLERFKKELLQVIDDDFIIESIILNKDQIDTDNLSSGLNSKNYFDIISNDTAEGIYIIDQPEDDVSQKSIKECLLADFKKMSNYRQVILITHNPQFVVNLDVDNVVCITKKDSTIDISYGALEYQDSTTNIINLVAENLDGGVDSIKKRWKRYGKEIKSNQS